VIPKCGRWRKDFHAPQHGVRIVPALVLGSPHPAASMENTHLYSQRCAYTGKRTGGLASRKEGQSMSKFLKHMWSLVRNALWAFRLYEFLRDRWNDPL
jgi:hypothetical protein